MENKQLELEKKQEALVDALWDAYNTLDELYRPLQIKQLKSKIDDTLSTHGMDKDEEYENDWTDRVITAIERVDKMRKEYLQTFRKV
jgi:RNAse (barnase) inhibitor barstar